MRVLLIFPGDPRASEFPPLGLAYLAAVLKKNKISTKLIDTAVSHMEEKELLKSAKKFRPDIIGVSAFTPLYDRVKDIVEFARENFPHTKLIIGGPHATACPKDTLSKLKPDVVVIGEGEVTTLELMKSFEENSPLKHIKGVAFRDGRGRIVFTEPRPLIQDLDSLPFPDRSDIPVLKYPGNHIYRRKPFTTVMTGRGCPFNCTFCASRTLWGKTVRRRSVENIVKEIKFLKRRYGIKEIYFPDDLFTLNRKWLKEFCETLIKKKVEIYWKCLSRVDTIDKETLSLMKKSGCHTLEIGVESGNQKILRLIKKGITLEKAREAFKLTRKLDIDTQAFFMVGNQGENRKTIEDTINFIKELNPDWISVSIAVPLPGTEFYEIVKKGKLLLTDHWEDFNYRKKSIVKVDKLKPEQLEHLQRKAFQELYSSRRYISDNLLYKLPRMMHFQEFSKFMSKVLFISYYTLRDVLGILRLLK